MLEMGILPGIFFPPIFLSLEDKEAAPEASEFYSLNTNTEEEETHPGREKPAGLNLRQQVL